MQHVNLLKRKLEIVIPIKETVAEIQVTININHTRFTTVPFEPLSDQYYGRYRAIGVCFAQKVIV